MALYTIAQTPLFIKRSQQIMTESEIENAINYIASHPNAGVSLGGGLRKVRIPREGSGKSGGFRIILVFGGEHMPVYLLTVYAKSEKDNISSNEKKELIALSKILISSFN
ncbi:conserved hypothetical protein (plasmid) [Zymomonas mobilis subsp. pomaceae ATCC 29192]|uniref:Addiction module toxin RelE n=2 Tax=Zymomonas mobilis TaxID=542 RepID=F8EWG3_ZYMMT|nr:conserved hypothetical protein [Zymomonas mobilis subsp. pomaceae ATCC 29192]